MMYLFSFNSNDSWFSVGSYFRGNIFENTTDNIDPAASDVFYILNYDDLCSSYGRLKTINHRNY